MEIHQVHKKGFGFCHFHLQRRNTGLLRMNSDQRRSWWNMLWIADVIGRESEEAPFLAQFPLSLYPQVCRPIALFLEGENLLAR